MRLVGQADELQERQYLFLDLCFRRVREAQRECDVVVDSSRAQQVEVLEDHADVLARLAQLFLAHGRHVLTVDDDLAGRRALEHVDAADQRGLACAAEADDTEDLAALDRQVNALERLDGTGGAVIRLLDMRQLYHRMSYLLIILILYVLIVA